MGSTIDSQHNDYRYKEHQLKRDSSVLACTVLCTHGYKEHRIYGRRVHYNDSPLYVVQLYPLTDSSIQPVILIYITYNTVISFEQLLYISTGCLTCQHNF